jgi:CPA1 family monovalent cation:H+ antiporter
MFTSFTLILSLAALFSFINHKFFKLPTTIGLMIMALVTAFVFILIKQVSPATYAFFCQTILDLDFKTILLDVMLSFLLFAGALHVNLHELKEQSRAVILFSTVGVLISTFIVGGLTYLLSAAVGLDFPVIYAFLFGALISPTDPIAVLALLKEAAISERMRLKIEGESLFNDGIGVVVFVSILSFATMVGGEEFGISEIIKLFLEEALGGLSFGIILGLIGMISLKSIQDAPKIAVLITLAIVTGGYALASLIHVSGPLAMVAAGLMIGHRVGKPDFNSGARDVVYIFWDVLDDVLNGVLFVLIGLIVFILDYKEGYLWLGLASIILVLIGRFVSVSLPYTLLNDHIMGSKIKSILILTWGGLRGGISVALALSLEDGTPGKDTIVFMTYMVVVFSIIVQGLTLKSLVKRLL